MSRYTKAALLCIPLLAALLLIKHSTAGQNNPEGTAFYVAVNGSDEQPGSVDAPFATLERARNAIRELKQTGPLPEGGVTVYLRAGAYPLKTGFKLSGQDSGSEQAPVTYRSYPGETARLLGGRAFSLADFSAVTDPAILSRLPEAARGKVIQIDLKAAGITHIDPLPLLGHSMQFLEAKTQYRSGPKASELFVDGQPGTIARWPNEGYTQIEEVVERGDIIRAWMDDAAAGRAMDHAYVSPEKRNNPPKGFAFKMEPERLKRWEQAKDVMMDGYWFYNYSTQSVQVAQIDAANGTISTVQPSAYGIRKGQRYYVYNLLEEIDVPGEWFIDRASGILYLFPQTNDPQALIEFSLLTGSLISVEDASHLRFEGLEAGVVRGRAFFIKGGSDVTIENCRIGNTGTDGVAISGGRRHTVRNSVIFNTGADGVDVNGGDTATLTPSGHLIENNEIRNFARVDRTYRPAVHLHGVGHRVRHNEIHDSPHMGIGFSGNNHVIEFNHIYNVCRESDDASAIYAGRSWTTRGTVIRYNLIRDIVGYKHGTHRASGVYLDDGLGATTVTGNIFLHVAQGLMFNGGRNNHAENNLFIDNDNMMRGTDMTKAFVTWAAMSWKTLNNGYKNAPVNTPAWREAYPELPGLLEDDPQLPKYNTVANNLRYHTPLLLGDAGANFTGGTGAVDSFQKGIEPAFIAYGTVENNPETQKLPGSYDEASKRFRFDPSSGVFSIMPALKEIPVERIGRITDQSN